MKVLNILNAKQISLPMFSLHERSGVSNMECDYLVIGAGVNGMSFVDELLHSSTDLTFIIIDKHAHPGGHWNDSYDFVTLHQPAQYYGVKSLPLASSGTSNDLSSHNELRGYFERVMKNFLSTGRVRFFPQCEYKGVVTIFARFCSYKYPLELDRKQ